MDDPLVEKTVDDFLTIQVDGDLNLLADGKDSRIISVHLKDLLALGQQEIQFSVSNGTLSMAGATQLDQNLTVTTDLRQFNIILYANNIVDPNVMLTIKVEGCELIQKFSFQEALPDKILFRPLSPLTAGSKTSVVLDAYKSYGQISENTQVNFEAINVGSSNIPFQYTQMGVIKNDTAFLQIIPNDNTTGQIKVYAKVNDQIKDSILIEYISDTN